MMLIDLMLYLIIIQVSLIKIYQKKTRQGRSNLKFKHKNKSRSLRKGEGGQGQDQKRRKDKWKGKDPDLGRKKVIAGTCIKFVNRLKLT